MTAGKWLKQQQKADPKLGYCERLGRYHCLNDKRGNNPGWCVHCNKEWVKK